MCKWNVEKMYDYWDVLCFSCNDDDGETQVNCLSGQFSDCSARFVQAGFLLRMFHWQSSGRCHSTASWSSPIIPHPLTAHWIHPHHLHSPFPLLPPASSPCILVEIRTDSFPTKGGGRNSISLKKDLWKCLLHLKTDLILEDTCLFFFYWETVSFWNFCYYCCWSNHSIS